MVQEAVLVEVSRTGCSTKFLAEVEAVAHDLDLALLTVADPKSAVEAAAEDTTSRGPGVHKTSGRGHAFYFLLASLSTGVLASRRCRCSSVHLVAISTLLLRTWSGPPGSGRAWSRCASPRPCRSCTPR